MIIVLKANRSEEQVKNFISNLTDRYDVSVNTWVGTHSTVLGLIGDTAAVDSELVQQPVRQEVLQVRDIVEMDSIIRVSPETDSLGMGLLWAADQPIEG